MVASPASPGMRVAEQTPVAGDSPKRAAAAAPESRLGYARLEGLEGDPLGEMPLLRVARVRVCVSPCDTALAHCRTGVTCEIRGEKRGGGGENVKRRGGGGETEGWRGRTAKKERETKLQGGGGGGGEG